VSAARASRGRPAPGPPLAVPPVPPARRAARIILVCTHERVIVRLAANELSAYPQTPESSDRMVR